MMDVAETNELSLSMATTPSETAANATGPSRASPFCHSTPSDEWAEAAPLGRFRLAGNELYRLGSDASGAFVDRYDLEAT